MAGPDEPDDAAPPHDGLEGAPSASGAPRADELRADQPRADEPRADQPRTDQSRADEPRGRDIATSKSTADLEQRLDPATIAQLASWFGLPSFEQLQEQEAERERADADADVGTERRELNARIAQDIDPALVAQMERWSDAGDRLLKVPPPPALHLVDDLVRVDALVGHIGSVAEPRETLLPTWIEDVLATRTAQAILRDLHRPETTFSLTYEYGPPEPSLSESSAEVRKVFLASYRVRPEPPTQTVIDESLADLRKWKRVSWGELPIERRTHDQDTPATAGATVSVAISADEGDRSDSREGSGIPAGTTYTSCFAQST